MSPRALLFAFLPLAIAASAVAADEPLNPYENVKAGQWVRTRSVVTLGEQVLTTLTQTWVVKVDGKKVTQRTQMLNADGKTAMGPSQELTLDLASKPAAEAPKDAPAPVLSKEELEVAGKKLKCQKSEVTVAGPAGNLKAITWICLDVPFGIVRAVTQDEKGKETSRSEVVAWGDSGAQEVPVAGAPPPVLKGGAEGGGERTAPEGGKRESAGGG